MNGCDTEVVRDFNLVVKSATKGIPGECYSIVCGLGLMLISPCVCDSVCVSGRGCVSVWGAVWAVCWAACRRMISAINGRLSPVSVFKYGGVSHASGLVHMGSTCVPTCTVH